MPLRSPVYKFRISRHMYHPVPKVDGGVVDFALIPPEERVDVGESTTKQFLGTVRAAAYSAAPASSATAAPSVSSAAPSIKARLNKATSRAIRLHGSL